MPPVHLSVVLPGQPPRGSEHASYTAALDALRADHPLAPAFLPEIVAIGPESQWSLAGRLLLPGSRFTIAPTAGYAWRIDTWPDVDGAPRQPAGTIVEGPESARSTLRQRLRQGEGQPFRLRDGDEITCCLGALVIAEPAAGGIRPELAPLQEYGIPVLGCTEIQYHDPSAAGDPPWRTF
jgi:hypothetical protein